MAWGRLLWGAVRTLWQRSSARSTRSAPAGDAYAPTRFADTQDLLDDVRAPQQTRGMDVQVSDLDKLPADVRRHFDAGSPRERR